MFRLSATWPRCAARSCHLFGATTTPPLSVLASFAPCRTAQRASLDHCVCYTRAWACCSFKARHEVCCPGVASRALTTQAISFFSTGITLPPACTTGYLFSNDVSILGVAVMVWLIAAAAERVRRTRGVQRLRPLVFVCIMAAVLLHPTVTSSALNIVNCKTVQLSATAAAALYDSSGSSAPASSAKTSGALVTVSVLESDPFVPCFGNLHSAAGGFAAATLLTYIALMPALTFLWLWRDPWLANQLRSRDGPAEVPHVASGVGSSVDGRRSSLVSPADVALGSPDSAKAPKGDSAAKAVPVATPLLAPFLDSSDYDSMGWYWRHIDVTIVFGLSSVKTLLPIPSTLEEVETKLGVNLLLLSTLAFLLLAFRNPYKRKWQRSTRLALIALSAACASINGASRALDLGYGGPILAASIAPGAYCILVLFCVTLVVLLVGFGNDIISQAVLVNPDTGRSIRLTFSRVISRRSVSAVTATKRISTVRAVPVALQAAEIEEVVDLRVDSASRGGIEAAAAAVSVVQEAGKGKLSDAVSPAPASPLDDEAGDPDLHLPRSSYYQLPPLRTAPSAASVLVNLHATEPAPAPPASAPLSAHTGLESSRVNGARLRTRPFGEVLQGVEETVEDDDDDEGYGHTSVVIAEPEGSNGESRLGGSAADSEPAPSSQRVTTNAIDVLLSALGAAAALTSREATSGRGETYRHVGSSEPSKSLAGLLDIGGGSVEDAVGECDDYGALGNGTTSGASNADFAEQPYGPEFAPSLQTLSLQAPSVMGALLATRGDSANTSRSLDAPAPYSARVSGGNVTRKAASKALEDAGEESVVDADNDAAPVPLAIHKPEGHAVIVAAPRSAVTIATVSPPSTLQAKSSIDALLDFVGAEPPAEPPGALRAVDCGVGGLPFVGLQDDMDGGAGSSTGTGSIESFAAVCDGRTDEMRHSAERDGAGDAVAASPRLDAVAGGGNSNSLITSCPAAEAPSGRSPSSRSSGRASGSVAEPPLAPVDLFRGWQKRAQQVAPSIAREPDAASSEAAASESVAAGARWQQTDRPADPASSGRVAPGTTSRRRMSAPLPLMSEDRSSTADSAHVSGRNLVVSAREVDGGRVTSASAVALPGCNADDAAESPDSSRCRLSTLPRVRSPGSVVSPPPPPPRPSSSASASIPLCSSPPQPRPSIRVSTPSSLRATSSIDALLALVGVEPPLAPSPLSCRRGQNHDALCIADNAAAGIPDAGLHGTSSDDGDGGIRCTDAAVHAASRSSANSACESTGRPVDGYDSLAVVGINDGASDEMHSIERDEAADSVTASPRLDAAAGGGSSYSLITICTAAEPPTGRSPSSRSSGRASGSVAEPPRVPGAVFRGWQQRGQQVAPSKAGEPDAASSEAAASESGAAGARWQQTDRPADPASSGRVAPGTTSRRRMSAPLPLMSEDRSSTADSAHVSGRNLVVSAREVDGGRVTSASAVALPGCNADDAAESPDSSRCRLSTLPRVRSPGSVVSPPPPPPRPSSSASASIPLCSSPPQPRPSIRVSTPSSLRATSSIDALLALVGVEPPLAPSPLSCRRGQNHDALCIADNAAAGIPDAGLHGTSSDDGDGGIRCTDAAVHAASRSSANSACESTGRPVDGYDSLAVVGINDGASDEMHSIERDEAADSVTASPRLDAAAGGGSSYSLITICTAAEPPTGRSPSSRSSGRASGSVAEPPRVPGAVFRGWQQRGQQVAPSKAGEPDAASSEAAASESGAAGARWQQTDRPAGPASSGRGAPGNTSRRRISAPLPLTSIGRSSAADSAQRAPVSGRSLVVSARDVDSEHVPAARTIALPGSGGDEAQEALPSARRGSPPLARAPVDVESPVRSPPPPPQRGDLSASASVCLLNPPPPPPRGSSSASAPAHAAASVAQTDLSGGLASASHPPPPTPPVPRPAVWEARRRFSAAAAAFDNDAFNILEEGTEASAAQARGRRSSLRSLDAGAASGVPRASIFSMLRGDGPSAAATPSVARDGPAAAAASAQAALGSLLPSPDKASTAPSRVTRPGLLPFAAVAMLAKRRSLAAAGAAAMSLDSPVPHHVPAPPSPAPGGAGGRSVRTSGASAAASAAATPVNSAGSLELWRTRGGNPAVLYTLVPQPPDARASK